MIATAFCSFCCIMAVYPTISVNIIAASWRDCDNFRVFGIKIITMTGSRQFKSFQNIATEGFLHRSELIFNKNKFGSSLVKKNHLSSIIYHLSVIIYQLSSKQPLFSQVQQLHSAILQI